MAWFKLDDGLWLHPKTVAVGNAGMGAFCRLGCWSSQQLTEGHIASSYARSIASTTELRKLVEAGYLHRPGDSCRCLTERHPDAMPIPESWSGYWIHDFLDYNPPRAKVLADRAAAAERMRKAREARRAEKGSVHA